MQPNELNSEKPNANATAPPEYVQPNSSSPTIIAPNQLDSPSPQEALSSSTVQPTQTEQTIGTGNTFQNIDSGSMQTAQPAFNSDQLQPTTPAQQTITNAYSMGAGGAEALPEKPKKRKVMFASVAAVITLLAASAGFVFGIYMPNQPDNVWKTGLERTGDEFTAFIDKLADPATLEKLSKNKVVVSGNITSQDAVVDLSLDSVFDQERTNNKLSVSADFKEQEFQPNITLLAKTQIVENSIFPNVYFNLSGISDLGLDLFLPGISEFDAKWIAVEQDFYDEVLQDRETGEKQESRKNITQQDLVSLLYDVNEVTQEYVFTGNAEKGVFKLEEFIATEESEGITANHYKASLNIENVAVYCKALIDKVYSNESFVRIAGLEQDSLEQNKQKAKESCEPDEEQRDSLGSTFDLWVDKKYKLIHKVRVYEDLEKQSNYYKEQKRECEERSSLFGGSDGFCDYYDELIETGKSYIEFGQIYKGTGSLVFFAQAVKDTNVNNSILRSDIDFELEGLLFNGSIRYTDKSEKEPGSAEITIKTEPYDGEIDTTKPTGAIPLLEVYEQILLNMQSSYDEPYIDSEQDSTFYDERFLGLNTDSRKQNYLTKLLTGLIR